MKARGGGGEWNGGQKRVKSLTKRVMHLISVDFYNCQHSWETRSQQTFSCAWPSQDTCISSTISIAPLLIEVGFFTYYSQIISNFIIHDPNGSSIGSTELDWNLDYYIPSISNNHENWIFNRRDESFSNCLLTDFSPDLLSSDDHPLGFLS